ncbi:MAG: metal ABC transporter substrate-binding protein [Pirellulales bacterium]
MSVLRPILALLIAALILGIVGGYSWLVQREPEIAAARDGDAERERPLRIVCSTTQVADLARQVVGDRCEVRSILAPGQDPHLYEIKTGDAELVASADLCLENGWHLEGKDWMSHLARQSRRPLVTCVTGIEPLHVEGEGEGEGGGHDPHAWLTTRNATIYLQNILQAVSDLDPAHRREYAARAALYLEQLERLDRWIREQVDLIPAEQRILVTSHDAFHYFCREYGFQAAAPTGWSTGEEIGGGATPQRRREVVDSIRQFGVKSIFVETSVNPKAVRAIAEDAGVRIGGELYSDSMGPPGSAGETYLGMMRENVLTIVEALR